MRIVILQPNKLGDVIVATPMLRQLRLSLPSAIITIVLGPSNRAVLPLLGNLVDDALLYKKSPIDLFSLFYKARHNKYDFLIDLAGCKLKSSWLLVKLIGAQHSIGFENGYRGLYEINLPMPLKNTTHVCDRIMTVLKPLGANIKSESRIELNIPVVSLRFADSNWPPQRGKKWVLVNISATTESKFWGIERYSAFLKAVRPAHPNLEFVLVGDFRDRERLEKLSREVDVPRLPLAREFVDFAAYVNVADYVITPETSVIHLAAAWKKPCLGLYTQSSGCESWLPYRSPSVAVFSQTQFVADISVEEVVDGFSKLVLL